MARERTPPSTVHRRKINEAASESFLSTGQGKELART